MEIQTALLDVRRMGKTARLAVATVALTAS
jgi:hypothetical protein